MDWPMDQRGCQRQRAVEEDSPVLALSTGNGAVAIHRAGKDSGCETLVEERLGAQSRTWWA